jgi:hypothetical protein
MRTGDVILHRPSGEKWLVAWADDKHVICCGWPESQALIADCDLIEPATEEKHRRIVTEIATLSQRDLRQVRCAELLASWQ